MGSNLLRGAIIAALGLSYQAHAYDCAGLAVWDSTAVYTSGDLVQTSNHAYQASHWTQGNDPVSNSGDWEAWKDLGQCDTGGGNADPEVSISSPVNNAEIPEGTVTTIQASASDSDGNIAQVAFLVDDQNIATVTQAPYQTDWTAVAGTTTISVIATDNENATSETQIAISVTLAGEPIPPSVTLTSPSGSEQLTEGDLLTLSANASDTDGSVDKVEFFVDGQLIASDTSAPYETTWTSVSGTHNFKAKATDNDNQTTSTQEVSLVVASSATGGCAGLPTYTAGTSYSAGQLVQNHNQKYRCDIAGWCSSSSAWAYEPGQGDYWDEAWTGLGACAAPPAVTITSPSDNQILLAGSTVSFTADASDSDGTVSQVEFFAGSNSLGVVTQPPYTVSWTATQVGLNSLKAIATDNENNTGEATVSVTVSDQDLVVALTSPTAGQTVGLGKSVQFAADATSLSANVTQVDFLVNGSIVGTDITAPYSYNWTAGAVGSYTVAAKATDSANSEVTSDAATITVVEQTEKTHKLIGYWHNFVNGAGCPMRLADMSDAWDVIDIAFADNDRNSDGTVHFNLYSGDIHSSCAALNPTQFKQDMAALQAKGKKFVLSLGGAEGTITLNTDQDEANFVSSLTDIIKEWGFDGLDVDLESGSNLVHGSQIQARLGRALLQIEQNIGGDMYLTMAPEHPYVQGGFVAYSGIWGAYIPVINDTRSTLDLLHVQLYNNGGLPNPYTQGSAAEGSVDMMVAQSKMLIEGFELANGTQFAPLRDDQVAIGLPSGPSSANSGQAPTPNILDALDCLTKGTSCDSVIPAFNYPNFAGVMTWSINWDEHDGYIFSGPVGDKLTQMNNSQ
ncbi:MULTISPECIES: Ig-like domain-containing protein [Vibrio]|uniref:Ig-like domain-containing protein n=1 Tax=Vibrio TaxID=662 RepID=UPI00207568F3|nr:MULTISPECIES: Ig-like domain-containing protein [Vibrio]USD31939.1 chitinase [Vibrio sp. SCSIO 43186]USD44983.1 chitinase [Vibrio sp. SCSIO 43145]USD69062.1 chitinase [Vibrio sp. SCSIO 43139]USD96750.1 chitinase [Vibrio coralliilyticus]